MPPSTTARRSSGGLIDTIKTIIYAVLIAIVVRTVAFEPFNIPSGSMIPTLLVGDYLFVSKFSYGYSKYSLPIALPFFHGRIFGRLPTRGDVAVFKLPSDTDTNFIKRIVGLPGDHIKLVHGQLYINNELVPRTDDGTVIAVDEHGNAVDEKQYIEALPGGRTHLIAKQTDTGGMNDTQEYIVPPDHVFGMGDNRDNSLDSRYLDTGVGYIPLENLVGRAEFVFFSFESDAPWWQFWEWPGEIRWSRLFSAIT